MAFSLRLLMFVAAALVPTLCFNVDPVSWKDFGGSESSFGYKALMIDSDSIIVSAPLETSGSKRGRLYKCTMRNGRCTADTINGPTYAINVSLGLSMDVQFNPEPQLLACGPTLARKCEQFVTYNGICYQLNQDLSQPVQFPDRLKECPQVSPTDIVFLMDGSGSVKSNQFTEMKTFIKALIKKFMGRNTQFAVAQYSSSFRTEMSFTQFNQKKSSNLWEWTIDVITQMRQLTHTPSAIRKVVREVFTSSAGSRSNANKVLIVITDGVTYGDDTPLSEVAREAQNKGVIRYAVGVGDAFNNDKANEELRTIASNPPDQYVFKVTDFNALDSIKDKLQDRIFAIEGTQASGESLQLEMAQEGFSALLLPDWIVVGAVGAYEWTGAFMKKRPQSQSLLEQKVHIPKGSYLGYSVKAFRHQSTTFLALGAPRYSHKGAVSVTTLDGWEVQKIDGSQVGSYFGAELCMVDFKNSGTSDLLLIGAPMHYENGREGQVTVCTLKRNFRKPLFNCDKTLYGQSTEVHSRFGATLAEVQDFNGDSIKDVVIGAPMENNGQGSIYLYHGKLMGLTLQFSQRIEASKVSRGLQYFGQSVHGIMDISGDNIPDLVIGALGKVFILRSRPIFAVKTTMKFSPDMIKVESGDCENKYMEHRLTICFTLIKKTNDNQGQLSASINYTLSVDAKRTRPRAQFPNKSQHINAVVSTAKQNPCQDHSISVTMCPEDSLTPVDVELKFMFLGDRSPDNRFSSPILDQENPTSDTAELNFEQNCGEDKECKDFLRLSFNFSGASYIGVGISTVLNLTVSIQNDHEDSYNTEVAFLYPRGLSYRRITLLQTNSRMTIRCDSAPSKDEDLFRLSTCAINKPIFRSLSKAVFVATFDVDGNSEFDPRVNISATALSSNKERITNESRFSKEIPVKFAVNILVRNKPEDSTKYVNFSLAREDMQRAVEHHYEVGNLGQRQVPVNLTVKVPVKLGQTNIWKGLDFVHNSICSSTEEVPPFQNVNFEEIMTSSEVVNCTIAHCRVFNCMLGSLETKNPIPFKLKGNMTSGWIAQTKQKKLSLQSSATLSFNEDLYIHLFTTSSNRYLQIQASTVIELYEEVNFIPIILGSCVGGLVLLALITAGLYKAGFFKRQYKTMMNEHEDPCDAPPDGAASPNDE
ncbi:integrin alpha-M-like [Erpetoichthys calabaricus]|uniref:Integrin alpha-M-like n=1 Tax=Erpetoichthys calabaricus TaxID=27687 RepID=A0A8C4TNH3_ERPCA|nr:integrin alpha-M-like [Erpetoichthys calabaricus]